MFPSIATALFDGVSSRSDDRVDETLISPLWLPSDPPRTTPAYLPASRWLTDNLLFHFQRCERRAYFDMHDHSRHRDAPSDYLLKLREDSSQHRQEVLQDFYPLHIPEYRANDWPGACHATLALMQQGVDYIARGVLVAEGAGVNLVSQPDLLIKQPGTSQFGDWVYLPADIKFGKKPKQDYQVIATFHALILAAVQDAWPETSWLLLRQGKDYGVDLAKQLPRLFEVLDACIKVVNSPVSPEVFIAHSRCDLCHWNSSCYQEAKAQNHLSLLPGVTSARYAYLQAQRITTVEKLAATSPSILASLPGFGDHVAEKLVHQAQAVQGNCAIARTTSSFSSRYPLRPEDLPTASVELYFDIEAAPDKDLVYLHGVLVVDRLQQQETFYPLLAESPDQEAWAWRQFLQVVDRFPQAPVFHFCPYEAQTVRRLAQIYGPTGYPVDHLVSRFVDLHRCITEAVTLPIESYALKHIARWVGFDWRDSEANGAQSICWYDNWLATCDRTFLDAILRYNEDDCRATYWVKDWLVQFSQAFWTAENTAAS